MVSLTGRHCRTAHLRAISRRHKRTREESSGEETLADATPRAGLGGTCAGEECTTFRAYCETVKDESERVAESCVTPDRSVSDVGFRLPGGFRETAMLFGMLRSAQGLAFSASVLLKASAFSEALSASSLNKCAGTVAVVPLFLSLPRSGGLVKTLSAFDVQKGSGAGTVALEIGGNSSSPGSSKYFEAEGVVSSTS